MNEQKPWPRFQKRRVECLDGIWEFAFLGETDMTALETNKLRFTDLMVVPWAFDASPAYAGKRGAAAYRLAVEVAPGSTARLEFGAVSMLAVIYIDGKAVARNAGGFTPFTADVPPSKERRREIVVAVDNRFDPKRIPLHAPHYDFYQWGGILRSVYLHHLPRTWLSSIQVTTLDVAKGRIRVSVAVEGEVADVPPLSLAFDESAPKSEKVAWKEIPASGTGASPSTPSGVLTQLELSVPKARPWTPEHPELHVLHARLGDSDDMAVRFGLRTVTVDGPKLLLSGKPLHLLGYNRHESHPQFGPALPHAQILADIQILKDLGCNFVRGCHYPQDPRFLDLCDEKGLLVWEESLGWQNTEAQFHNADFRREQLLMIDAMVGRSFNHPSVILWGFLNEGPSEQAWSRPVYEECAARLRQLDPSRPVTYASHRPDNDLHYDLCDVISQNLYPGWYGDNEVEDRLSLIVPKLQRVREDLNRRGHGLKPYILSEIGAEGLYGWHDPLNNFFTEEFQAAYLDTVCAEVVGHPHYTGLALWHFADARTYTGARAMNRPRAFNNKGTLDEYRRPKAAWAVVRRHFRKAQGLD